MVAWFTTHFLLPPPPPPNIIKLELLKTSIALLKPLFFESVQFLLRHLVWGGQTCMQSVQQHA